MLVSLEQIAAADRTTAPDAAAPDAAPDGPAGAPASPAEVGGKAVGLARLHAAGLPVPPTRVLPASAERAPWPAVEAALAGALAELGAPLVARSSASVEDRAGGAAPGLFRSVAGLADLAALTGGVRDVWASARAPIVAAYLARHAVEAEVRMAVVLQPELRGATLTIYTRRPGADDELLAELADGTPLVLARDGHAISAPPPGLPAEVAAEVTRLALAAEAAIGAGDTGADVELVLTARGPVLVQARPLVAGPAPARLADATLAFSAREPDAVWRWDASHNPTPLSPAQAGLVALVDAAAVAPLRQRVVDGYLYATTDGAPAPRRTLTPTELPRVFRDELGPAMEAALARLEATPPPALDDALAAYLDFYARYAELWPAVSAARRALVAALEPGHGARAAAVAGALVGPVGATTVHGPVPIAWDVAADAWTAPAVTRAPTPTPVASPSDAATDVPTDVLTAARAAAAIAEADDAYFARAQLGVRRSIAALADAWGSALDDLVHLPLDELRAAARAGRRPADLAVRAAEARATRAAQARRRPPSTITAGRAIASPVDPHGAPGPVLRGRGSGGQATGPVRRLSVDPSTQPSEIAGVIGAVIVSETILPGMAVAVAGAAALVAEHGGLLGHGAALARELGIPCVVGCTGALAALAEGDRVLVDGSVGLVLTLEKDGGK